MERTISVTIGKGSVNHNRRIFMASNVDRARTPNNIEYVYQDIHDVYHILFDESLEKFNSKQKRNDRKIENYYEHIRTSKQEKVFYEVIFQVGNKDDTNAQAEDGLLAKEILDEFAKSFQERNPNLYVFSAHLHMDEETPHLHIDFVPFTTGSKRGLETRNSLKKALEQQGFKGAGRSETEWNLWIQSEKDVLSSLMEKHQMQWKKLGTHEKHLSVLNFEKKMRSQEVKQLEEKISELNSTKDQINKDINNLQTDFEIFSEKENNLKEFVKEVGDEDFWSIKEPSTFETAKSYHKNSVIPFIHQIKAAIQKMVNDYLYVWKEYRRLRSDNLCLHQEVYYLNDTVDRLSTEIIELREENRELKSIINKIQKVLGAKTFTELLQAKLTKRRDKHYEQKEKR